MVNSIFMTLFGVDFQFQCPREETENAQKALNWILMATLLQNDPFFLFGGEGVRPKWTMSHSLPFFSRGLP